MKEDSPPKKNLWRLPRMGCFLIFGIFWLAAATLGTALYHSWWKPLLKLEIPTEKVSIADPEKILLEDDREELLEAARKVSETGQCSVAVMFINEKNSDFLNVFYTVMKEWAPRKGVLLMFALRNHSIRMELTGQDWKLDGWDREAVWKELSRCSAKQRGRAAILLLRRLRHALESGRGKEPSPGSKAGNAVLFTKIKESGSDISPAGFSLFFSAIFLLIGILTQINGRKVRKRCLEENPKLQARYDKKIRTNSSLRLVDMNQYDKEDEWPHRPWLKITAIILGILFGFSTVQSVSEEKAEPDRKQTQIKQDTKLPVQVRQVVDQAGVFSAEEQQELGAAIRRLEKNTGGEMMVLTVPTIGHQSIEEFSLNAASNWKIGKAGKDNGALLVLAIKDRKNRLEIGYGWEGPVNDARAGDLLRSIVPELRAGKYAAAAIKVVNGVEKHVLAAGEGTPGTDRNKQLSARTGGVRIYQPTGRKPKKDPRQPDPAANFWAVVGIVFSLAGIVLAYWGRLIMTSVPRLTIYDSSIRRTRSSGRSSSDDDSYSSDSSHDSSYSSDDSRGGGSFGGGGASGSW